MNSCKSFLKKYVGLAFRGSTTKKSSAKQLLERIFNQNEQAQGLFYFHGDSDAGISVNSVALLRVSVSLDSINHYETIKKSRKGRLKTSFQNKLGWLSGNLYSRIATPDWADAPGGSSQFDRLIEFFVEGDKSNKNIWTPPSWLNAAKGAGIDFTSIDRDLWEENLERHAPPHPKEIALNSIKEVVPQVMESIRSEQLGELADVVINDDCIMDTVLMQLVESIPDSAQLQAKELREGLKRLHSDTVFREAVKTQIEVGNKAYQDLRQKKDLTILGETFANTKSFNEQSINRIKEIFPELINAMGDMELKTILEDKTLSQSLIDRLRSYFWEINSKTLTERLVKRLGNNPKFTSAFLST